MSELYDYGTFQDFDEGYDTELAEAAATVWLLGDEQLANDFYAELDEEDQRTVYESWVQYHDGGIEFGAYQEENEELYEDPGVTDEEAQAQLSAEYDAEIARIKTEHPALNLREDVFHRFVYETDGDFDAAVDMYKDSQGRMGRHGHGATLDDAASLLADDVSSAARDNQYGLASENESLNDALDGLFD